MPIRTINTLNRAAFDDKLPQLNVVGAAAAVDAFPDESIGAVRVGLIRPGNEPIVRELFNSGANNLYYAYGQTCNIAAGDYLAWLVPGQMLEVPVLERVSVACLVTTTIQRTSIRMFDSEVPNKNIL